MKATVCVVGAGVGSLISIQLAQRGFDVILVDEASSILARASGIHGRRLHLGEHYSGDSVFRSDRYNTAQRCTVGALAWLSKYPEIAPRHGRWWQLITDNSMTSPAEYDTFCRKLAAFHADLSALTPEVDVLIGPPEERHTTLARGVYTAFVAPGRVVHAVESRERVIDQDALARRVANEIRSLPNLEFRAGVRVTAIKPLSSGFVVETGASDAIEVDFVVNCSWHDLLLLSPNAGLRQEEWTTRLRFMAYVDLPPSLGALPSMYFHRGVLGNHTNVDGRHALVMAEAICNFISIPGVGVPTAWRELMAQPAADRWPAAIRDVLRRSDEVTLEQDPSRALLFADLRKLISTTATAASGQKLHDVIATAVMRDYGRLIPEMAGTRLPRLRPTVVINSGDADLWNPESGVHGRDGFTREDVPGFVSVFPGKFTYAVVLADEAVAHVVARATGIRLDQSLDNICHPVFRYRRAQGLPLQVAGEV